MRWFLCRVGRHFFVTVELDDDEETQQTFCLWCGIGAHE